MKILVAYYSHGGNNRFIAQKTARDCEADIIEITPRAKGMFFVILSTMTGMSFGIRKPKVSIEEYDAVIACGPLYMGKLAAPVTDFLHRYRGNIRKLFFVTCCGGGDAEKDSKFGYGPVLDKIRLSMKEKYVFGDALPIDLIVPEELKGNGEAIMKLKLTDETFKGKIVERYDSFITKAKRE